MFHRTRWSSGNALDLYSGGAQFKSQLGHWLSCLRVFVALLSHSREMPTIRPQPLYLPSQSQFITHLSSDVIYRMPQKSVNWLVKYIY
jgi:hypothetical protein